MGKSNIKKENYTAIADFMLASLERDLADFTKVFKTIDNNYLKAFKKSNDKVKKSISAFSVRQEQKSKTKELHEKSDAFKEKLILLKAYIKRSDIEPFLLQETIIALKNRNIEKVVKNIREILPFFVKNIEKIKDIPEGFLDEFPAIIEEFETKNTEQNLLISKRKYTTFMEKPLYEDLYKYISDIANAGKIIYKNKVKKDDYTIVKIIKRLEVSNEKVEYKKVMEDNSIEMD